MKTQLEQAAFVLETVAHLRGMEAICLPLANTLREMNRQLLQVQAFSNGHALSAYDLQKLVDVNEKGVV